MHDALMLTFSTDHHNVIIDQFDEPLWRVEIQPRDDTEWSANGSSWHFPDTFEDAVRCVCSAMAIALGTRINVVDRGELALECEQRVVATLPASTNRAYLRRFIECYETFTGGATVSKAAAN
jgi:hypothetical protein